MARFLAGENFLSSFYVPKMARDAQAYVKSREKQIIKAIVSRHTGQKSVIISKKGCVGPTLKRFTQSVSAAVQNGSGFHRLMYSGSGVLNDRPHLRRRLAFPPPPPPSAGVDLCRKCMCQVLISPAVYEQVCGVVSE